MQSILYKNTRNEIGRYLFKYKSVHKNVDSLRDSWSRL